jgi:hypothetical protein
MYSFISRLSCAASMMAVASMLAVPASQAQKTETIQGGSTQVTFASGFTTALTDLGVTVSAGSPAEHRHGTVSFPAIAGAFDLDTAKAQILHGGGLTFTAGSNKVELLDFVIDTTGTAPIISSLIVVNGKLDGRVTLFDLALPTATLPLTPKDSVLQFKDVGITLDPAAATALNTAFSGSGFTPGFDIGTADVTLVLPWSREHDKK